LSQKWKTGVAVEINLLEALFQKYTLSTVKGLNYFYLFADSRAHERYCDEDEDYGGGGSGGGFWGGGAFADACGGADDSIQVFSLSKLFPQKLSTLALL